MAGTYEIVDHSYDVVVVGADCGLHSAVHKEK
jgi:hypothetical protein